MGYVPFPYWAKGLPGSEADELIPISTELVVVEAAAAYLHAPPTSQSPAEMPIVVMVLSVPLVSPTAPEVELTYSPTLPVVAFDPLVTPVIFGVLSVVPDVSDVILLFAPEVAIDELHPKPDPLVHCNA